MKPRHLQRKIALHSLQGHALSIAKSRLRFLGIFFVVVYSIIAIRALDISVIHAPLNQDEAEYEVSSAPDIRRGNIYDRNDILLASTLPMVSLYADPNLILDAPELADDLTKTFPELSYGETLQRLQSNTRFQWIKRNINPSQQQEILQLGQPGLGFQQDFRRVYPHGALASHLVGYTSIDRNGLAGIERSFNKHLTSGEDLTLTLDIRLQHLLHKEVSKAINDFDALAGSGVIMDARTGDVLAGISLPDYNPHEAGIAKPHEIFNRLTLGVYELGSMFKIFSTASVLETHHLPMNFEFDASKPIRMGRFTINDYHAEDRVLNVPEVFMYSSNIGSAKMGEMVGTEGLKEFYARLGLLDSLDFELMEIGAPLIPNPWREISTLTASYGHGIATSPLQMTAAVASIVNTGLEVKPRLVLPQENSSPTLSTRIVSEDTSYKIRQLMRLAVTEGTGSKADVPGYDIGGKTGTAEKVGANGRYDRKKLISSFVGTFPSHDPKYVIMVMVDEPKGNKKSFGYATAGWVAAPAVARIVNGMAAILGIEPDFSHDSSDALKSYVSYKKEKKR